jgi:hypothetical protein
MSGWRVGVFGILWSGLHEHAFRPSKEAGLGLRWMNSAPGRRGRCKGQETAGLARVASKWSDWLRIPTGPQADGNAGCRKDDDEGKLR